MANQADGNQPTNQQAPGSSLEQKVMVYKEVVTSLLGLAIVGFALYMAIVTLGYVGDARISDSKDILQLILGLAGVVLGYYFGRVPADARAAQSQKQADTANAHAQDVAAEAEEVSAKSEEVARSIAARGSGQGGQRGPGAGDTTQLEAQLRELSESAQRLAKRARRVP